MNEVMDYTKVKLRVRVCDIRTGVYIRSIVNISSGHWSFTV